ncbi:MAG: 3'(2'),5'-bisphosphate nucleotidase CysQ [Bacteroidota bacterium]
MEQLTVDLHQQVVEIAEEAGKKILEIYADEATFSQVDMKADNSPLTLADQAAHHHIAQKLSVLTPHIPVLSEEGKDIPYEERKSWTQFWLVDPLDGTKEFIKRNGEFTVNIALIENGEATFGVVHVPVQEASFYGGKKIGGAFVKRGTNSSESLSVSSFSLQDQGLRLVVSRSHMSAEVQAYVQQFSQPELVSMGSSLKFMCLAEGTADVYPRLAPTMEWDTGAAQAILEAAGGSIIDQDTQMPMRYNKAILRNPHFIALGGVQ